MYRTMDRGSITGDFPPLMMIRGTKCLSQFVGRIPVCRSFKVSDLSLGLTSPRSRVGEFVLVRGLGSEIWKTQTFYLS